MIDQRVRFSVAASAAPVNFAPTNVNPIPADGFLEIWGVQDVLSAAANTPASLQVTLGGATPFTPIPGSTLPVNVDGIVGAGPAPSDVIMPRQAVRQGTNLQALLSGGVGQSSTGTLRFRFTSMEEAGAGAGMVTS
jgi:hypothetical protein